MAFDGGDLGGLEGLLKGLMSGGVDGIWDNPMILNIAFHPRAETPQFLGATTGPIRDGTFDVRGGDKVSYRLYVPAEASAAKAVVYFFHGNAEICTAMDDVAEMLHGVGAALLSIDYRGYAWGTGKPSLLKLCSDAEDCFAASHQVLEAAGLGAARRVVHGRSIGATCAVHLASVEPDKVHGLIVDSGLMSIKQLPMVQMMGPMLFQQNPGMWQQLPEPFDTLGKLQRVVCPTLVMHGDQDEIVPIAQAVQCNQQVAAKQKKLQPWVSAGHNNVGMLYESQWRTCIKELLEQAAGYSNPFPVGALVEAHSLSAEHMNGQQGTVVGPQGERIRVKFADPTGEKAIKPDNLKLVELAGEAKKA